MLTAPLYKKFKNATNPQKFFRKQFVAAALTAFVASYGGAATIGYNIYQSEVVKNQQFSITSLFSISAIKTHGIKGGSMAALGYLGDIALFYSIAGIGYWRTNRKKSDNSPSSP